MLEPVEWIYDNTDCADFQDDPQMPHFLDVNHKIANIPEHKIERVSLFPYTPKVGTIWVLELRKKILFNMNQYRERFEQFYGHQIGQPLKHIMDENVEQLDKMLEPNRKRTITEELKQFFIELANTHLCSLQCQSWRLIDGRTED